MEQKDQTFERVMEIYNHIAEEERHFNTLELEYRKLASQWLLVSLGAIGVVLSRKELVPVNEWVLVIAICLAASVGIMVLWLLDLRVYHELLHAAFREGVRLENQYPDLLPQIRTNMVKTQDSGDIIRRVVLYYFFSVVLLVLIANIAIWRSGELEMWSAITTNTVSVAVVYLVYRLMNRNSVRAIASPK
jgi:hypothetical protein